MNTSLRLAALSALLIGSLAQAGELIPIDVHRDANCGCCKKWIEHLQDNGFAVTDHVESNMRAVKQRLGVAPRLGSCHTAVIDGKFVEGHVPRPNRCWPCASAMTCWASPPRACPWAPPGWKWTAWAPMPSRSSA